MISHIYLHKYMDDYFNLKTTVQLFFGDSPLVNMNFNICIPDAFLFFIFFCSTNIPSLLFMVCSIIRYIIF
jgi:hypothetical protein